MRWVWGGGVLMALGGALAMSDRRYRLRIKGRVTSLGNNLSGGRT